ncbi:S41 family peptidase [Rhodohalobacter sp.]|uniref:S41 family peptidase n=1 Tax=Rhodohalobacter sp. TaxID=1974210 RepID=UPI002ACDACC0|nr:S41 family peptidase [Rhodohalobacter sp.]MDZ7756669.1 S41 family peptidase [Rhodohalobacter sp.]
MKAVYKRRFLLLIAAFLIISTAFTQVNDLFFQIKKQLTIFTDVYKEIAVRYVDEVAPETLMQNAIKGMLSDLDPYTVFVNEGEQQQMEILTSGSYGGIGIEAGYRGDRIVVIAPMDGYPAQEAGIRPGDVIAKINGVEIIDITPEEVQQLTIGDVGSEIEIVVTRTGVDQPITFNLERERIEVKNISYFGYLDAENTIGYVQLNRFGHQTGEELRAALLDLESENEIEGLVLDLRNNPGGLLNEAIEVVDKFLEPGITVVETRSRFESQNSAYATEEPPLFEDLPMIVLINSGSASASEIVAGALQDLDRAVIMGEQSFGKGLVQTVRPLSYNTSLKMTVSKYLIPSGRSIQSVENKSGTDEGYRMFRTRNGRDVRGGLGIEPDVTLDEGIPAQLDLALAKDSHIFFYVNEKLNNGDLDSENMPEDFYRDFVQRLIERGFSFDTSADEHLKALEKHFQESVDQPGADDSISELKALMRDYKIAQLYDSKEFIKNELQKEWISQTKEGDERQQALLQHENIVLESLELIRDRTRYDSILKP